jgi:hypothetical protein
MSTAQVTGIFSVLSGTFFWLGKLLVMRVPDATEATGGSRDVPRDVPLLTLVDPSTVRVLWAFCGLLIETIPSSLAVERGSSDQTLISFFGMLRATWRLLSGEGTPVEHHSNTALTPFQHHSNTIRAPF